MLGDGFDAGLCDRLTQEREVVLYCDFHGHSRKQNVFIYGCDNRRGVFSVYLSVASNICLSVTSILSVRPWRPSSITSIVCSSVFPSVYCVHRLFVCPSVHGLFVRRIHSCLSVRCFSVRPSRPLCLFVCPSV